MNLEDLVGEDGLQQDEWSLTAPTFGKEGQLTVVGWSGRTGSHKFYILKCDKCSEDSELFGEGYFKSLKGNLVKGGVPCGCVKSCKWTEEQFYILCSRKANELGYNFLDFTGDWKGARTRIKMLCEKHGEWDSGVIHSLHEQVGCPRCKADKVSQAKTKASEVMIKSFLASGRLHPDTKFWRSERKDKQGVLGYWFILCPECGEIGESHKSNLQKGSRSCGCNFNRQKEAYINLIMDNQSCIGLKFGIAADSKKRLRDQNKLSAYEIIKYAVYTFPSVVSCRCAELECKQTLECQIVSQRDMPDGYTETTWAYNLEKIIEIYERNGGCRTSSP